MTDGQDFDRPFLMQDDDAAKLIVRGIERRMSVVEFPWQLAAIARSSRLLPSSVYDRAVKRALESKSRKR